MQIEKETILIFIVMLLINTASNATGTLKNIFVTKQVGALAYVATIVDGTIYAFVLKSFSSNGMSAMIAYVLGRIIGLAIGNVLEKKIAVGINDIELYVKSKSTMLSLQSMFMEKGISSTAIEGIMDKQTPRYCLKIQIARKEMDEFYNVLEMANITNPTMIIKEVKKVTGNIENRIKKNGKYKNILANASK